MKNVLLLLMLPVLLAACFDFDSPAKWRADMPDDGTMLCSMAGEGFRINNNAWGFRVDREKAFDSECVKRVK